MSSKVILPLLILLSCSTSTPDIGDKSPSTQAQSPSVEFSPGEIILSTQLLIKIFDQEMAPIVCVGEKEEASLLIRTINPRMEFIQDEIEAVLDNPKEIEKLISQCHQDCTCHYLDDLFKEHQVDLDQTLKTKFKKQKDLKTLNQCLNYIKSTFCESELYLTLEKEKNDFSFEEE